MKYNWVPVIILFYLNAVHSQRQLEDRCPEPEDVRPCRCFQMSSHYRAIHCKRVNDVDTIRRVFQNTEGYRYREIRIQESTLPFIPKEIIEKSSARFLSLMNLTLTQLFDSPPQSASIVQVHLTSLIGLGEISWSLFQGLTSMEYLFVEYTPTGILGPSFSLHASQTLKFVSFRNSEIEEIKAGALSQLLNLSYVTIVNSGITSFTRDIFPQPWNKGLILELSYNNITSISEDLFTDMPNLTAIYLDGNFISELPESAFQRSSVDILTIRGSPLNCDCKMRWLLNKTLVKEYVGKCASPERLEGKPIEDLAMSDFQCEEIP